MEITIAIRNIRKDKDGILRKVSKPVDKITPGIDTLIDDMVDTLEDADGAGIAAVQVGVLRRIAIVKNPDTEKIYVLINPAVMENGGTQEKLEACLSISGLAGIVPRPAKMHIKAQNRYLQDFTLEAGGLFAIIIAHELDHLDGVLFTDKASRIMEINSPEYREILERETREDNRPIRKKQKQRRR